MLLPAAGCSNDSLLFIYCAVYREQGYHRKECDFSGNKFFFQVTSVRGIHGLKKIGPNFFMF